MFDKKYGLVLGGGAARGLGHIGVLQFLEEENIKIIELSCNSMGAVIGGLWALGFSSEKIKDIFKNISYLKLFDIADTGGIIKGKKIYNKLSQVLGNATFEDTKIPLKIIATNIDTGEKTVFQEGKIIDAIRASISVPGILKPHKIHNSYFIDGGMIDNLPIEEIKTNKVIAVSALRTLAPLPRTRWTKQIRQKDILRRVISIVIKNTETWALAHTDKKVFYVNFPDRKIGYIDFFKGEKIINYAYDQAQNMLKNKI